MKLEEALKEAIESLEFEAEETYEGSEREEPECEAFIHRKNEAAAMLRVLRGML